MIVKVEIDLQKQLQFQKLLTESWVSNATARPFVEQLLKLFESKRLSEFDLNFLDNWLEKKGERSLLSC